MMVVNINLALPMKDNCLKKIIGGGNYGTGFYFYRRTEDARK